MATLLNGRTVSDSLLEDLKEDVAQLNTQGIHPKLVVIVVGENPASAVYVKHKQKACESIGMLSEKHDFPDTVSQKELIAHIEALNADASVNGMIVQLPLPAHIEEEAVIRAIAPSKDVDGFHAVNMGETMLGRDFEFLSPCTPKGIIKILEHYEIDPSGMDTVVVGRSNIVGKPIAMMLLNRNATVTVCHSRTKDLKVHTSQADLLVVAVGRDAFIGADMVKEGAVVIDVGINRRSDGTLCGDVDFEAVEPKVSAITPVPKGVGPMTVACLLENTILATKAQANL